MMWFRRKRKKHSESMSSSSTDQSSSTTVPCYSYSDLQSATENFSPAKMIEDGQFGELYKGELSDGTKLAVKKLTQKFHKEDKSFASEVSMILAAEHPNLVKLKGCCMDADNQFLLYEFLENSIPLSNILFSKSPRSLQDEATAPDESSECLSWQTRINILIGVARGLVYLHEKANVVHGDVRAKNILVDDAFSPKICEFGLVNLLADEDSYVNARSSGTFGYMAPEYALEGKLTAKADVFSFGVLILEVVSGRNNLEPSLTPEMLFLLEWTWKLYQQGRVLELVDKRLQNDFPTEEVFRVIHIALLCTQASSKSRPSMFQTSAMLTGDWEIAVFPSKPGFLTDF